MKGHPVPADARAAVVNLARTVGVKAAVKQSGYSRRAVFLWLAAAGQKQARKPRVRPSQTSRDVLRSIRSALRDAERANVGTISQAEAWGRMGPVARWGADHVPIRLNVQSLSIESRRTVAALIRRLVEIEHPEARA